MRPERSSIRRELGVQALDERLDPINRVLAMLPAVPAAVEGLPEHVPYWVRENFEVFRGWKDVVPLVRSRWPSLVTGDIPRETAFATLAAAFGEE
ncbi:MAG TPA: hypothetical protein VIL33_08440 [Rhodothermia bacterium]